MVQILQLCWLIPLAFWTLFRRAIRKIRFMRLAVQAGIQCSCGDMISLLGIWRCRCGFQYRGHLLRTCPVCYSLPRVARCYSCMLTTKLPEI
jgi:hypothetical protein